MRSQTVLVRRYIWLMSTIYDAGRISYEEIEKKWLRSSLNDERKPFPLRTFHDHVNAIQELFDVNIVCDRSYGYKYYIENADDLDLDSVCLWMLNSFSVSNALAGARDIRDRILIQDIPSSRRWLAPILAAIREKQVIEIDYLSFQKGEVPARKLCPFYVKLYDNRWYMFAREPENPKMKVYALDRIKVLRTLDEEFTFEPTSADRESIDKCFGHCIYEDIPPQVIRIKATKSASNYLETLPLHKSQRIHEVGEDYVIYEYEFAPTTEFQATLRKWGNQLEICKE
ncbi:MAG: hypothetical protein BWX52_02023 [Bacteroidetes bacterium ADurb.Bin013]|nr:MAG: hypothetical protein BWX52_02023 [Bacteroidetes bacterium ADurb.Bin013]